jgi:Tol biopolymer transport system component
MIAVRYEYPSGIWIVPSEDMSKAEEIVSGANYGDAWAGLSWTPDGRILYESDAGQDFNIWIMNPDGSNRIQLTSDPEPDLEPVMTRDGRYVVFVSVRNGWSIWRMNADGSNLRKLTQVSRSTDIECSPDSQWVIYLSREPGGATLRKISIEGGEPIELSNKLTERLAISPDGKLIAGFYLDEQTKRYQIRIIPFSGGDPVRVFDTPTDIDNAALHWSPDGRALTYCRLRVTTSNIWSHPINGGPPKQLTDFKSQYIEYFDWSRDGRRLAMGRGTVNSDAVLISDFN